jgi:hypothetical protein
VQNVLNADVTKLRFSWKSFRVIYTVFFLLLGTFESGLVVRGLFRMGFNIGFAEGLLFFVTSMIRAYIIFAIGIKWKEVMVFWHSCEKDFLKYPYVEEGMKLKTKCRLIFAVMVFQVFGENFSV